MDSCEKMEKILKAFADKSRLQILECMKVGVSTPGQMAKKLGRHRSTTEKHLRILQTAGLIRKMPSLDEGGHLTVRYRIQNGTNDVLVAVRKLMVSF